MYENNTKQQQSELKSKQKIVTTELIAINKEWGETGLLFVLSTTVGVYSIITNCVAISTYNLNTLLKVYKETFKVNAGQIGVTRFTSSFVHEGEWGVPVVYILGGRWSQWCGTGAPSTGH